VNSSQVRKDETVAKLENQLVEINRVLLQEREKRNSKLHELNQMISQRDSRILELEEHLKNMNTLRTLSQSGILRTLRLDSPTLENLLKKIIFFETGIDFSDRDASNSVQKSPRKSVRKVN
jgi:glutamate mutase epsilon subunit